MDTSGAYIKMCEKAFKDIGISPDNGCPSQFITKDRMQWPDGALLLSGSEYEVRKRDPNIIGQLYRQDQLQEMVKTKDRLLDCSKFFTFACCYGVDHIEDIQDEKISMEQLWLAFVMKELHYKVWDGEDWIEHQQAT